MKSSLTKKTAILITVFILVIMAAALFASYKIIEYMLQEQYKEYAINMAETAAAVVIPENVHSVRDEVLKIYNSTENKVYSDDWGSPEFEEYVGHFSNVENMHEFHRVLSDLHLVQDRNNVDCLYILTVIPEDKNAIYLVDAADEEACMPGVLDPLYDFNEEIIEDPDRGFPAYITNTEPYGWLVTGGVPIKEGNKIVGYALCDISMAGVVERVRHYTLYIGILLVSLSLIIVFFYIALMEYNLIIPIKMMVEAAYNYAGLNNPKTDTTFASLDIETGDELQLLSEALKQIIDDGGPNDEEQS